MKEDSKSVAYMLTGSVPVAIWMQLTLGSLNTRIEDLSAQIKRMDQQLTTLQLDREHYKTLGKK
jgi:hypothetical protein